MKRKNSSQLQQVCRTVACVTVPIALVLSCGREGSHNNESPTVSVAVAGNFAAPHAKLSQSFEATTGIRIETSLGATGQLYTQIVNGAPFDVFLAADTARPHLLEADGLGVPGTRFTYAIGRLVLFAPSWDSVGVGKDELRLRDVRHLAIASPRTAPYGAAAMEVLRQWELEDTYETRIVRGENVGQAYQFVESGAAEAGFIALSQVIDREPDTYWIVTDDLHQLIRQDAILLRRGQANPNALAYLAFLKSEEGMRIIADFGYSLPRAAN